MPAASGSTAGARGERAGESRMEGIPMISDIQAASGPMMSIEGPQTIADVERQLSVLETERQARLLLPVRLKKWWFGGEASLIQLLVTWGRSRPDTTLVTHIKDGEDPA